MDSNEIIDNILNENYNLEELLKGDSLDNINSKDKEELDKKVNEIIKKDLEKEIEQEMQKEISLTGKELLKENSIDIKNDMILENTISNENKKKEMEKKNEIIKREKDEQMQRDLQKISQKENKGKENEQEKKIKKKKEEELKKLENFYPAFPNPLDFIQYLEVDRVNGQISNEMKNFVLQNNRKNDNKYEVSQINTLIQINNEISKYNIIAIGAKNNNVILYTKESCILFFSLKDQKLLKKFIPKNLKTNSKINCFDVTDDYAEIVCGYEDGTIAVINIIAEEVKYINNKLHKDCACLELKIYKKEKGELHFISSGADNQVFYVNLKMSKLLFWKFNSQKLNINNISPIFMIKFITFSMENQRAYSNLNLLRKYVILGSLELISFYCVEPFKEVFKIKKPEFIKECVVPDSQIGIGRSPDIVVRFAKKDEKNHLLLIISWGKIIYFYQLPIIGGDSIENYKELGYYINLFNILRIGFMNNSVIYCLDKSFAIKVLDSSKINPGKINISNGQPVIPKNNSLAEIEKSRLVSANISSQNKLLDEQDYRKESYLYSIVENNDSVISILVLGEKELYNVKLIDWEFFLNNLQKKEDFLNLFSIGIDLYKGKMMALSNIPEKKDNNKSIGNFLKQIVSQYVILNTGEKKTGGFFLEETEDKEKIDLCIRMSIEFCIEIGAVEYLFKTIEPIFETKDYGELFLEKLQPFILCDKIIDIVLSSDIVLNLIELYNKNGKHDILSQMLLHINIKSIDTIEIKNKMEEMNLITPLIYLYMNGQKEDYFAPLEKMFDFFNLRAIPSSKILFNDEDNTIDYSKALSEKKITSKEVLNCKEYNGHKILWYIKLCLTGKKFPDNSKKMEKNLFDSFVPKVTYWLLNPKVIDEFLRFDPKNYFMIHKNIFSIDDLRKKLLNAAKDSKYAIEVKASLSISDIKIEDIQPISLIKYLVNWCKKKDDEKISFYLYDFIISILNVEKGIEKQLKQKSICCILKNYKKIVKHLNNLEVKSMNNNLIKLLEKEKEFNTEDFKNILESISDNIFNEVKLFLFDKIDYFDECLKLYLNKDFIIPGKSSKLYKWLNDKIREYKKQTYKYNKLRDSIKENILPLASISLSKFYELSKEIFQGYNKQIIIKLSEDQNIQLKYIELLIKYIINTYENNEYNVSNDEMDEIKYILEMHIFLLCELNMHDKIISSLKSCPFYPLKQCLKYCENSKAYQPCLFLYLKEGSIEKAFEMSKSRLQDTFNKLIKNIDSENSDSIQTQLLNEFHKYLSDIKNICENNNLDLEKLWFQILEELYKCEIMVEDMVKKYEFSKNKKENSNNLYKAISTDIKELMERMCSFVSIKRIIDEVTEKNKNAGFKEFRDILMEILGSYSNLSSILNSASNLLTNLVLENEEKFQILNLQGELLNAKICCKCRREFNKNINNKEHIMIFKCKHNFHKNCIAKKNNKYNKEIFCPICSELEFMENEDKEKHSLIKENNSIITERNEKNNNFQIKVAASVRKTLQKLEKYDNLNLEKHKDMIDNTISILKEQFRYNKH